jgi:hypothetical protein
VRITAKGRREMALPIGKKTDRDIHRHLRVSPAHPNAEDPLGVALHVLPSIASLKLGDRKRLPT